MEEKNLVFKFKNTDYNILVSDYESGFIRVSMQNIETKEIKDITIDGVHTFIPSAPTPNCALIKDNNNKKLIKELLKLGILDYWQSLMARFNMDKLYVYDKVGVKKFLDKYTHKKTYRKDKGNSEEEIKRNIKSDAIKIMKSKSMKKEGFSSRNFLYSILVKSSIKDSFVAFDHEDGEYVALIQPYVASKGDQVKIIPDYNFSAMEWIMGFLDDNCELLQLPKESNKWIVEELSSEYPNFEYKKGIKKYLRYCVSENLDKEEYMKEYENIAELMKKERKSIKRDKKER